MEFYNNPTISGKVRLFKKYIFIFYKFCTRISYYIKSDHFDISTYSKFFLYKYAKNIVNSQHPQLQCGTGMTCQHPFIQKNLNFDTKISFIQFILTLLLWTLWLPLIMHVTKLTHVIKAAHNSRHFWTKTLVKICYQDANFTKWDILI